MRLVYVYKAKGEISGFACNSRHVFMNVEAIIELQKYLNVFQADTEAWSELARLCASQQRYLSLCGIWILI